MALTGRNLNYLMGRKHVDAATLSKEIGLGIATVNAMRREWEILRYPHCSVSPGISA